MIPSTVVYQGNVSAALVRIGELFRDAVRRHAAGIIIVHNHPSGDPTPSPDDLHLTAEAVAAGRLLDVPVLDHVILGHGAFVSLRDRGITFDRALPSRRPDVVGPVAPTNEVVPTRTVASPSATPHARTPPDACRVCAVHAPQC